MIKLSNEENEDGKKKIRIEVDRKQYLHEWYLKNRDNPKRKEQKRKADKKYNETRKVWKRNSEQNEKHRIHSLTEYNFLLDDKCIFCGTTERLEHAHLDYEDNGVNVVTACHQCNIWMDIPIGEGF